MFLPIGMIALGRYNILLPYFVLNTFLVQLE